MDIDILELSDKTAKFILYNVNASFANGIRRSMISDVPKLAIEYLKIYDNTSVLYGEQLGLRLTLIPLVMDSNYITQEFCSCDLKGCPACEVSMRLDAEGPKMVYSKDIISSDPKVQVSDPKIPIIELKKGQVIMLEAFAHVGFGRDHVRWQAGVACGYKNMPIIKITDCDLCGSCVSVCPKKIIKIEENVTFVLNSDLQKCSLCKLCEKTCDLKEPAIKITYNPNIFIFSLESDGSYSAYDLVLKASDVIKEKSLELENSLLKENMSKYML